MLVDSGAVRKGTRLERSGAAADQKNRAVAAGDTDLFGDSSRTHCGTQSPDLSGVDRSRTALIFSFFFALAIPSRWRSSMISRSQVATSRNA